MRPLNLAREPFRNDRLPTLLLGLAILLLLALSVRHGLAVRDLRPGGARDNRQELAGLEKEIKDLRAEANGLREVSPRKEAVREWKAIAELVGRRAFSWTGLFAALEGALPPGVRLVSVSPSEAEGATATIQLAAVGRSIEDALALPKALMAEGEFEGAFLESYGESDQGVNIQCSVRYVGPPRPPTSKGEP